MELHMTWWLGLLGVVGLGLACQGLACLAFTAWLGQGGDRRPGGTYGGK